ncbi:MAG: DUF2254 domain-containing protein [Gillisia sp.]
MKQLYNKLLKILHVIKSKIIFYPTVFAVIGILFAFIIMYLENLGISRYLLDNLPILVVDNGDTALTILSAIITGLISMMVFSFSMVMLLLSQASSNYSPRLLPGLISDKSHQIILGIYLGTILYCIFILFSIQPTGDKYQIPGFSVLLGIVFTVACIYAFIYFIHNISENIQISKILDRIFLTAQTNLTALIEEENEGNVPFPETNEWKKYYTEECGYLQNISIPNIVEICKQKDIKLHVLPVNGVFVLKGIPLFRASKELDKETVKSIISNFNFSRGELVQDNYVLAFKQITEIILKAMSPGINDPGTALNGIDYLSELFSLRMQKKDRNIIVRDNEAYLRINTVDFDELLYNVMAAIRTYCKHDIILIQKLMLMLQYLKMQPAQGKDLVKCIELEAKTLINDARRALTNKRDLEKVDQLAFIFGLPEYGK